MTNSPIDLHIRHSLCSSCHIQCVFARGRTIRSYTLARGGPSASERIKTQATITILSKASRSPLTLTNSIISRKIMGSALFHFLPTATPSQASNFLLCILGIYLDSAAAVRRFSRSQMLFPFAHSSTTSALLLLYIRILLPISWYFLASPILPSFSWRSSARYGDQLTFF